MNKLKRMNGRERTFLLITIPILALFFCFNTLPLIKGVIYSFTNFRGYGEFDWVGIRNYTDLFTDARVGKSYLFTFKLAIVATIVVNVLSLVLALGLNSKIKFKSALRGMYFVPNILGALVVSISFLNDELHHRERRYCRMFQSFLHGFTTSDFLFFRFFWKIKDS